jgi:hypothetical protein
VLMNSACLWRGNVVIMSLHIFLTGYIFLGLMGLLKPELFSVCSEHGLECLVEVLYLHHQIVLGVDSVGEILLLLAQNSSVDDGSVR